VNYDKYLDINAEEHHEMVDKIRKRLKINTLVFQQINDLVSAIGLPKEKLCTHCWIAQVIAEINKFVIFVPLFGVHRVPVITEAFGREGPRRNIHRGI